MRKGKFTLRCILEWRETTGSGKSRSSMLVHEELWSGTWSFEQSRNFGFREEVELRYEFPPDAQGTELSADRPIFWELEVYLDLPGVDFKETYLVPVYGPATASGLRPNPLGEGG